MLFSPPPPAKGEAVYIWSLFEMEQSIKFEPILCNFVVRLT
jgi:hypothetical protein